ncbi:Cell division protein DamX [Fructobacillus tropaeoli]|uniref:serine-rich aggregation substance UasX n=1 Tax=Fructobacillus tropaeoli TaxID=709323 RepID=UPI002DA40706|nr:Cell division protein DamX [Fructobacillus tropaeoli]
MGIKHIKKHQEGKKWVIASTAVLALAGIGIGHQASADTVAVDDGTSSSQTGASSSTQGNTVTLPSGNSQDHTSTAKTGDGSSNENGTTDTKGNDGTGTTDTKVDDGTGNTDSGNKNENTSGSQGSTTDTKGNDGDVGTSGNDNNQNGSSNNQNQTPVPDPAPSGQKSDVVVPLTPDTPDVNEKGKITTVQSVPVQADSQGQVVAVPQQVATVPSVARAVQHYNETLEQHNRDASQAPVVQAHQELKQAIDKALPLTGKIQRSTMNPLAVSALVLAGVGIGLLSWRKRKN